MAGPAFVNAATQAIAPDTSLAPGVAAAATSFSVSGAAPSAMFNSRQIFVLIDEGSLDAEFIQVASASGRTFNVNGAFVKSHAAGAPVRWIRDGWSNPFMFGGRANAGTYDDAMALQRSILTTKCDGVNAFVYWSSSQPLFNPGGFIDNLRVWQHSTWDTAHLAQADPLGEGTGFFMNGSRTWGLFTISGGAIHYTAGLGIVAGAKIAFNDAWNGGGFPSGITPGRIYWVKTVNDGTGTITAVSPTSALSSTITLNDGAGTLYSNMDSDMSFLWGYLRMEMNVAADVSGVRWYTNQPCNCDILHLPTFLDASSARKAVGLVTVGQGGKIGELVVDTSANCLGFYLAGSWYRIYGQFYVVGPGQSGVFGGQSNTAAWGLCESFDVCGIEFATDAGGIVVGELHRSSGSDVPLIVDNSGGTATWQVQEMKASSTGEAMIQVDGGTVLRSADNSGNAPTTGITDPKLTTGPVSKAHASGLIFGRKYARSYSANFDFLPMYNHYVCTGTITGTLISDGTEFDAYVKNNGVGVVTIAASGGLTIDGVASITIAAGAGKHIIGGGGGWVTV